LKGFWINQLKNACIPTGFGLGTGSIVGEELEYVENLRSMRQEAGEGSQGKSCKQQEHENLVPQPSEDPVRRRQVGRGQAGEGLYPVHPFGLSQKGRLKREDLETITGRGGLIELPRPFVIHTGALSYRPATRGATRKVIPLSGKYRVPQVGSFASLLAPCEDHHFVETRKPDLEEVVGGGEFSP
jgi:hypothetical protein